VGEIQVSKKVNNNYGSTIVSNTVVVDSSTDLFPFTRAEKNKLATFQDINSIVSTFIREVPGGAVNGINNIFTLTQTPISIDFLNVFVNGIKREVTYLNEQVFMIGFPPSLGSTIEVTYFVNTTVIDPALSQLNLDKLTNFYNAYMSTIDVLTNNVNDVITDNTGGLIYTN